MINSMVLSGVLFFSTLLCLYSVVFAQNITSIITQSQYEQMLKHRNDPTCFANTSYTYQDFVTAANSFQGFGTTGDNDTRKREVAAFFGQTSHLTNGGGSESLDGPYAWGYCFLPQLQAFEGNLPTQCDNSTIQQWPCVPGQKYYSRGPIQLTFNYNYGAAGQAIGIDLLNNPDLVSTNATISFMTAIWFWMTSQPPMPSSHDAITSQWTPSSADLAAGRAPGYGQTINMISGGTECGNGSNSDMLNNIGYYKSYCDILQVGYGNNLDCAYNQLNLIPKVSIQLIGCTVSVLNELLY